MALGDDEKQLALGILEKKVLGMSAVELALELRALGDGEDRLERRGPKRGGGFKRRAANAFAHLATPIALYVVLQIAVIALQTANSSTGLISAAVSLLTAWIVVRLVTLVIRSPFWSRVTFYVIWPIMAVTISQITTLG